MQLASRLESTDTPDFLTFDRPRDVFIPDDQDRSETNSFLCGSRIECRAEILVGNKRDQRRVELVSTEYVRPRSCENVS